MGISTVISLVLAGLFAFCADSAASTPGRGIVVVFFISFAFIAFVLTIGNISEMIKERN